MKFFWFAGLTGCLLFLLSCEKDVVTAPDVAPVTVEGAMRRVMHAGQLDGIFTPDTLADRTGLIGVGPLAGLRGEITILDGHVYVSRVDSTGMDYVVEDPTVTAPFFVHASVPAWRSVALPPAVRTIQDVEDYLRDSTPDLPRPFAFKLSGAASFVRYHVQNLPPGSVVSSPAEAHAGQVNYSEDKMLIDVAGFYSPDHHGVFTHHDSDVHLHVISRDRTKMGHLDEVAFEGVTLYLPVAATDPLGKVNTAPRAIPLADGEYDFTIGFAEFVDRSADLPARVIIRGDSVRVHYAGEDAWLELAPGDLFEAGTVRRHRSGQFILSTDPADVNAPEIGGCSDGPAVIDFTKRIFWIC